MRPLADWRRVIISHLRFGGSRSSAFITRSDRLLQRTTPQRKSRINFALANDRKYVGIAIGMPEHATRSRASREGRCDRMDVRAHTASVLSLRSVAAPIGLRPSRARPPSAPISNSLRAPSSSVTNLATTRPPPRSPVHGRPPGGKHASHRGFRLPSSQTVQHGARCSTLTCCAAYSALLTERRQGSH